MKANWIMGPHCQLLIYRSVLQWPPPDLNNRSDSLEEIILYVQRNGEKVYVYFATLAHSLSLSLSLSLSHTHTHTYNNTHTYTHKHIHTQRIGVKLGERERENCHPRQSWGNSTYSNVNV